jgi:hypothetical protein
MLVQVTTRDTSDEDSAGLSRRRMVMADKVLLTEDNEMGHFAFDEVPDPDLAEVSGISVGDDRVTYR